MYLKIIWESGREALVECSCVRVSPIAPDARDGGDRGTIQFEAVDRDYRPQACYRVSPRDDVHVFVMNDAGDTIENWHADRRAALLERLPDLTVATKVA